MGIASEFAGIFAQAERLFSAGGKSFTAAAWKEARETAKSAHNASGAGHTGRAWEWFSETRPGQAAIAVGEGAADAAKWTVFAPFRAAFAVGRWAVEAPISFLILKPVKAIFGGLAGFYERAPRAASVLTAGGALITGGSWLAHRQSAQLQEDYGIAMQAQAAAMQQQALAAQAAEAPSYKNIALTEPEAARLGALDTGKAAQGGHTAALTAAREQAKATEAAASAAPVAAL